MDVEKKIEEAKLVPVVVLKDADKAKELAGALISGGLPVAEITFRTDAAEESIRKTALAFPDMLIGAGSVTGVEQAKRAVDAGARFIVTAGFSRAVTEYAVKNGVPIFPGVCTPSELMLLLDYDLYIAKFFPAQQYGGVKTINALSAPFPQMRFMPTGGINIENIMEYLALRSVIACGGSWMVKSALIEEGSFKEVERLTAEAIAVINGSGEDL